MISLKHVFKTINKRCILNDINLVLPDKGLYTILGASGSGKTTLLNIIGLIDKPSSGAYFYNGFNTNNFKEKDINFFHKEEIGFVHQAYHLFPNMKVIDNINLCGDKKNTIHIMKKIKIDHLANEITCKLSGGEMQRVAIARALIKRPRLLLCDEPTGALDSESALLIMKLLKDISKNTLVIMVSHNEELAYSFSDDVIKIYDGNINYKCKTNIKYKHHHQLLRKTKLRFKNIIKITKNNFMSSKKRNLLTIVAFMVGLISLALVLGIKNGFSTSLDKMNKNELALYPIYISKNSTNITNEINELFDNEVNNKEINMVESEHINNITKEFVDNLNFIKNDLKNKYIHIMLMIYLL